MNRFASILIIVFIILFSSSGNAIERAPRISDKEIIESLAALKEGQASINKRIDDLIDNTQKQFDSMQKQMDDRFNGMQKQMNDKFSGMQKQMDDRFNGMQKQMNDKFSGMQKQMEYRFGSIQKQIDDIKEMMRWGGGLLFGSIIALITIVIWDRRTAISPAIRKNKELEEREEKVERAFKELARRNPDAAEALRFAGLL